MTGGLLQLVAYGDQDRHLIGNPEMTFFKMVYKRYTNFAIESKKVDFKERLEFGKRITCTIPKSGDLINNIALQVELPILENNFGYVNNVGHALIESISIEIGNTEIDILYGDWLNIWSELHTDASKKQGLNTMTGKYEFSSFDASINKGGKFLIPLYFWFNNNNGLSIPLVALQYHDVVINLKMRDFSDLWIAENYTPNLKPNKTYYPTDCSVLVDYVYLDTKERKNFAQNKHEFLIKQIQLNKNNTVSANNTKKMIDLNFSHPVSELIWVIQRKDVNQKSSNGGSDWFNYSDSLSPPFNDPLQNAKILFNGTERTLEMEPLYLRLYQPYLRHTNIPNSFIYCYSFSLRPENSQPSGACNFSRFDNTQLYLELKENLPECDIRVYAVNYNILRIMCGMGGVAYMD